LAHHFTRSENTQKAVKYLSLAGQQAVQQSANTEAINHLTAAVALLKTLPDTPERSHRELTLQIALGNALIATKGYAAAAVEEAYTRARELCQQQGDTPQLFPVLFGLWVSYLVRAELQTARELAEQFLLLAQRVQDPTLLVEAHYVLGLTLYNLGELVPAQAHAEQGIALYDLAKHRSLATLYGEDPGVLCLCITASTRGFWGYPDRALKTIAETLTLARELAHPHSLANGMYYAAELRRFRQEGREVQEKAEAVIALANEQRFAHWAATGTILRGWALAEQGQVEKGIVQMRQGLGAYRATGGELWRPYYPESEAEASFLKAIDIAQKQQAKSLELRAVMSLGRLWQQQGKQKEAHKLLSEIYTWFTEGFDTKDLQEAKALLEEFSRL
jgi:predicted ATPase